MTEHPTLCALFEEAPSDVEVSHSVVTTNTGAVIAMLALLAWQ